MRFAVAKKIVERAADYGIPARDVVVDPLVMPIGALGEAGVQVLRCCGGCANELKVNTTCGASNITFGLPHRHGINAAFLPMVIGAGMTSAIMNPLHAEMEGVHGRRRDDGPRPGLHALDQASFREAPALARPAGARAVAGGRRGTRASRGAASRRRDARVRMSERGRAGRLHAVGQARALSARHAGAPGRAHARRRYRFGVRRPRPSAGAARSRSGRRIRQARRHLQRRRTSPPFVRDRRALRARAALAAGRRLSCSGAGPGRPRHRRARRQPGAPPGRAQGGRGARRSSSIRSSGCTMSRCSEPDMHDPSGDLQRLERGARARMAAERPRRATCSVLQSCSGAAQGRMEGDRGRARAAASIIAIWPGFHERVYGLAVDIGSTTIAVHLCDLSSRRGRRLRRAR